MPRFARWMVYSEEGGIWVLYRMRGVERQSKQADIWEMPKEVISTGIEGA